MFRKLFILYILLFPVISLSQNTGIKINGAITDAVTDSAISNVHIKIEGTQTGTSSDKKGNFQLLAPGIPVTLSITHVSYESLKLVVRDSQLKSLKIRLNPHVKIFREVIVSADKIQNLSKNKLFAVNDFEFLDHNILLLVYDYNFTKENNPWLVLMNTSGDTLSKSVVKKDGIFFKDCMDNIHFIAEHDVYQIYYEKDKLTLRHPTEKKSFFEAMAPCVSSIGNNFFLKQFTKGNQILTYYKAVVSDTSCEPMRVIADKTGLKMLASRDRFFSMGASPPTEADLRFEQMCFFDPVFSPLFRLKDDILIFNFVDSQLEFYTGEGVHQKDIQIDFHKKINWKEEIIMDERCRQAYTLFVKDGISLLHEIDLENGKIINKIKIPKFKYIDKIKIFDHKVYFLYRKAASDDLRSLYVMEI